jgi:hypothetical protein
VNGLSSIGSSSPMSTVPPRLTARRPTAPQAVRNAAGVMYTGAVAALVLVVVEFVTAQATKTALGHRYPSMSARDLAAVARFTVISEAVVALIVAGLFVWIARRCLDGKNWARITATVLGALGTWTRSSPSAWRTCAPATAPQT